MKSKKPTEKKIEILRSILKGKPKSMQEVIKGANSQGIKDTTTRSYLYKYKDVFLEITDDKWILVEDIRNKALPEEIIADIIRSKKENRNSKITQHRIVQSILIQVGKDIGYETYIPSQDKEYLFNKKQKLGDIVDKFNLPDGIDIPNIRTIDVIWFFDNKQKDKNQKDNNQKDNNQKVYSLFEVEDTDIRKIRTKLDNYKTLLQEAEKFFLIANISKQKFIEVINEKKYQELKGKVIFISISDILEFFPYFNTIKENNCLNMLV